MRRPVMYILLLVIYCVCSSSSGTQPTPKLKLKCVGRLIYICAAANRKRTDIDDGLSQEIDPNAGGERREIQEARGGEGREGAGWGSGGGGESESDEYRDSREGDDDLRSELNDRRRQPSDERQLVDIGNDHRGHSPRSAQLDSAIGRLRSLLGTTDLQDVDDRGEEEGKMEERQEEEEEEEPQRRRNMDTDKSYIISETQTLLTKILNDIESKLDSPRE